MQKIIAIASAGGHWVQLLRLRPAFEGIEVTYICTKKGFAETVQGERFYSVPDANRKDKIALLKSLFTVIKLVWKIRPNIIITTGAAPGLMALIAGKALGIKTIWIDSIANVEELSMSGKIASKFADKVYTQWEHLATNKIAYKGNVLL